MRDGPSSATPPRPTVVPTSSSSDQGSANAPGDTERTASGGPSGRAGRLIGVDATRGLALLGMMAVHALWAYDEDGEVT
jgi:hypothetical protein